MSNIELYKSIPDSLKKKIVIVPSSDTTNNIWELSSKQRKELAKDLSDRYSADNSLIEQNTDILSKKWLWFGLYKGTGKIPVHQNFGVMRQLYILLRDPLLSPDTRLTVFSCDNKCNVNPFFTSPALGNRYSYNARKLYGSTGLNSKDGALIGDEGLIEDNQKLKVEIHQILLDGGYIDLGALVSDSARYSLLSMGYDIRIVDWCIKEYLK